jgi:hypothetical protein
MKKSTLGVIFGNRDFFPDHLVTSARATSRGSSPKRGSGP